MTTTTNQSHEPERMAECGFNEAWIGPCKQSGNPRCIKHTGRVCVSCGADATHNCAETGQFVCGENLCHGCEHTIFPSGTNGGIGFNTETLPEGMQRHCKTTEQKFQPWYAREDDNTTTEKTSDFDTLWSTAPRSRTARIEREDAEWWFKQNKGDSVLIEQAKSVARAVRDDLEEIHRIVSGRIGE